MPRNQIVLDIETQRTFDEVGGRNLTGLGVSLVGIYQYATDSCLAFGEGELGDLEPLLAESTRLIGFNIRRFDLPILQPYMKHLRLADLPYLDLLEDLESVLGHRVSLQSVSQATLNEKKSGSGLDAIRYYREGDIENLKKYCLNDVRLTKEVYEFGKRFGHIYYQSKDGANRLRANVAWRDPEPPANLSLF